MEAFLIAMLPSLMVGAALAYNNRRQAKRDKLLDERAAARKQESLLGMELTFASSKLAYATAIALKRGHANGEVEDAVESYTEARKKYLEFINAQAADHLTL